MALTDKLSAIGNAIRAKTGKTDKLTLDQMPGEIASITGGGGSVAGCVTVTFMNGNTELFSRPVYIGDDCPNPITQGHIATTPTKESDVQYSYTFYGWGAADGGAADANILKNITADKTVYAIYTATARTYTITYYDSDGTTVLKTETLAYGTTPSYMPTKTGVSFSGWVPALAEVTGDASYVASWIEKLLFASASWEDIARVSEAGEAQQHFQLGDTRVVNVNGEDVTFYIAGFNHDDLADGSGKAGITLLSKTQMSKPINPSVYQDILFTNSDVYNTINSWVSTLDGDLQAVIKSVSKKHMAKVKSTTTGTKADQLWSPCAAEISKYAQSPAKIAATLGNAYSRFVAPPQINLGGYWLRDLHYNSSESPAQNTLLGLIGTKVMKIASTYYTCYPLLGFCV